jgi:hypothetical protein
LAAAAAGAGAVVINPAPWLCTATVCRPIIGDTAVYFDESHLSRTCGVTLAPELSAALSWLMPESGASG